MSFKKNNDKYDKYVEIINEISKVLAVKETEFYAEKKDNWLELYFYLIDLGTIKSILDDLFEYHRNNIKNFYDIFRNAYEIYSKEYNKLNKNRTKPEKFQSERYIHNRSIMERVWQIERMVKLLAERMGMMDYINNKSKKDGYSYLQAMYEINILTPEYDEIKKYLPSVTYELRKNLNEIIKEKYIYYLIEYTWNKIFDKYKNAVKIMKIITNEYTTFAELDIIFGIEKDDHWMTLSERLFKTTSFENEILELKDIINKEFKKANIASNFFEQVLIEMAEIYSKEYDRLKYKELNENL